MIVTTNRNYVFGKPESKTIGGTATNFLYDGLNLEQELSGTTPTANYLTGAGIDEQFSRTASGSTQSYLTDNLGSTLALTSSAGAIQTSYAYDPYGNTTATGTLSYNSKQYTGRENDGKGLYYYRARYYSPAYGRFISEDPIGFAGGVNAYAYVGGNPIAAIDPLGLCGHQHDYEVKVFTLCSAPEAFSLMTLPWFSAPGAPQAQPGIHSPIVLWGNKGKNQISQNVNLSTLTIVNATLLGHEFNPGTVTIQVTPGPFGIGSVISVTGTGTGPNPVKNDLYGIAFFGLSANLVAMICAGAAQ